MTVFDPIRPRPERLPTPSFADAMLMDVARRVQLSPTKHDEAQQHFEALCSYVDRPGSPLQDKVIACYPGGSFATGTAIASSVSKDQHDVDVVMELDVPTNSDPKRILPAFRSHQCRAGLPLSRAGNAKFAVRDRRIRRWCPRRFDAHFALTAAPGESGASFPFQAAAA